MTQYVVMGSADHGPARFYAVDTGSGYPYASGFGIHAEVTSDINIAIGWLKDCGPDKYAAMNAPAVHRVRYEPVDISDQLKTISKLKTIAESLTPAERAQLKASL